MKKVTLTVLLATIYEKSHCILQINLIYKLNHLVYDSYGEVIISFNSSLWGRIYKILILKVISMHVIWPCYLGSFFFIIVQLPPYRVARGYCAAASFQQLTRWPVRSSSLFSHRRGTTFSLSPNILFFIWSIFFHIFLIILGF